MLSGTILIKLYFVLNKLIYKHAEMGRVIYNTQRNPDVDNEDFIKFTELSLAISSLLEAKDNTVYEGNEYPYYGIISEQELDQYLDYLTYAYELDPVPYIDFPKNSTTYINTGSIISTGGGVELPSGGGPGFYLTKNASGQLVWDEIEIIQSDFNLL